MADASEPLGSVVVIEPREDRGILGHVLRGTTDAGDQLAVPPAHKFPPHFAVSCARARHSEGTGDPSHGGTEAEGFLVAPLDDPPTPALEPRARRFLEFAAVCSQVSKARMINWPSEPFESEARDRMPSPAAWLYAVHLLGLRQIASIEPRVWTHARGIKEAELVFVHVGDAVRDGRPLPRTGEEAGHGGLYFGSPPQLVSLREAPLYRGWASYLPVDVFEASALCLEWLAARVNTALPAGGPLRTAGWFVKATKDVLNSDRLRKAADRGKLPGSIRPNEKLKRWQYNAEEVKAQWPDLAPRIDEALEADKNGTEPD